MNEALMAKLKVYLSQRDELSFAYLFGSVARGTAHAESDVDIGVYFIPPTRALEYESERQYPSESQIWSDLDQLLGRPVDLVVLNRAPALLFLAIIEEGKQIFCRHETLLKRLTLAISLTAEDFRAFTKEFVAIRERSHSLIESDRDRLIRLIVFLENELMDHDKFKDITQKEYVENPDRRRNLERWVENIVNCSIDVAKTLLASEKKMIPKTYRETVANLMSLSNFDETKATALARFTTVRNLLAHEYLDLRFAMLDKFVKTGAPLYGYLIEFAKGQIK